jgi:hypothetical protein
MVILQSGERGTLHIRERKAVTKCRGFLYLLSENEPATEDVNYRHVYCHAVVFSYMDRLLNGAVSTVIATGVRECMCTENFEGRRNRGMASTVMAFAWVGGRKSRKRVPIGS